MGDQLKLPEVARRLGVSEKTARRYVKSGALPSVFVGNAYRVSEEDLEEFLKEARVAPGGDSPKESAPPPEPSLFNGLEEERRNATYGPWLDFANRYADRWEKRIASGDFDLSSVYEFARVLEDLGPTMNDLELKERRELPREQWGNFHENLKMNMAVGRLMSLFNPLLAAGAAKFDNSDLEQLRKKRAELAPADAMVERGIPRSSSA